MQLRIETIGRKTLVGMSQQMSLADNQTMALWQRFMPHRNEVTKRATNDYISMQVYDPAAGDPSSPTTLFAKWAVVEVDSADTIPDNMHRYNLAGGRYAVFLHKGPASDFPQTAQFIYGEWLPNSDYDLDLREHFEVLPEGYDPLDPEAEEEIWIPVR